MMMIDNQDKYLFTDHITLLNFSNPQQREADFLEVSLKHYQMSPHRIFHYP
jgi:hypothetical protein